MSFAAEVKKELTFLDVHPMHAKAELSAFVRLNGSISYANQTLVLKVQTENAAIARRIYGLIKREYDVAGELIVRRKLKLNKNNVYIMRFTKNADKMLADLGIVSDVLYDGHAPAWILEDEQHMRSYLRGAFLATGSINSPETSRYHLEIRSAYETHNDDIQKMMNHFDLNARTLARKHHYISYLKESEKISEFLAVIGASGAVLKFEDTRIVRDMRNSVNRLVNCESANLNKTVNAASKQLESIRIIDNYMGLDKLDSRLKEIAYLRLDNPEASLKELGEMVEGENMSKSGVNHRMRKLNNLAKKLESETGR